MHLQSSLAFALLQAAAVYGYANPGACSGACIVHDPAMIQDGDGTYYRFSTGGGLSYASSSSIEGPWVGRGAVLPRGSSIDNTGRNDPWAPDIQKVGNLYHAYYSVSTFETQISAIGLATSESMQEGTWTDRGSIGIESREGDQYNAIDANLLVDGPNNYMVFGSFWQDIFQVKLNGDATSAVSAPANVAFEPAGTHAVEGSYLFKYGDTYYLFYSWGSCCKYDQGMPAPGQEYKIKVCRSKNPTGPFIDADGVACTEGGGTIVLESHDNVYGPGGQGVYQDPRLGPVLYYHYIDTNIGYADDKKQFGWNALDFSTGWPTV
ncbi:endoarabinanase abnc-Penicillium chrysogenum [Penicillium verrucosum]|uniref:endoarabinanase abnc-Penicillium chrysogenum n=1 Tax=Penicillium verrucosum TaxID=60171 RepID=UPI002545B00A|nr:endoarabinanase abnc-Penicillium chrysogenum [Penicillium verrucosum]KAJ5942694.1 endoarabinanase abnc-Penicillium chrysogenum [Penicillium verrucosum]